MNKNKKGFSPLIVIIILAAIAVGSYALITQQNKYAATPSGTSTYPAIQNNSELDSAATDLDNTDTNQVDTELNQLNSDTSTF